VIAPGDVAEQRGEVGAGPEALFEFVGMAAGIVEDLLLAEDDHPRGDRESEQDDHHQLHRQAGVQHELEQVQFVRRQRRDFRLRQRHGRRGGGLQQFQHIHRHSLI
jgi:hypothetical protein